MSKKTTKTAAPKTSKKSATKATPTSDAVMATLAEAVGTPTSAPQTSSATPEAKAKGSKGRKARVTPTPSGGPVEVTKPAEPEGPTARDLAEAAKSQGAQVIEQSAFYQVRHGSRRLYISKSKKGVTRIDLAGFSVEHPAVEQLTEEEAKQAKLGKVRGQIFPAKAEGWFQAFGAALAALMAADPSEKAKAKAATAEVK